MKKRLLALLLVTFMLTAMISVSAFAEEAPVWTANGTTVAEGENGFYNVSGIQYSTTAYTTEKVKLDGLTVDFQGFADAMRTAGNEAGVEISVMHEDIFNSMHRI